MSKFVERSLWRSIIEGSYTQKIMENTYYSDIIKDVILSNTNIKVIRVITIVDCNKQEYTCVLLGKLKELNPTVKEVKDMLSLRIPEYLMPQRIVFLEPTDILKIKKQENLKYLLGYRSDIDHEYIAPRNEYEFMLCKIWESILKVDKVGVYDNFFLLGGNFSMAPQLIKEIRNAFRFDVPLSWVLITNLAICELSNRLYYHYLMKYDLAEVSKIIDRMVNSEV